MTNPTGLDSPCDHFDVDMGFAELSWLQMAALGVIQGITELLSISSTWIFAWDRLMFGVAIAGAVAAGNLRN